jgi:hypothetical protein
VPPDPIRPDAADRALGRRLAKGLDRLGAASPEQLRDLLPNLLDQEHGLQAPLHDLLGRPGFRRLLASGGEPQRGVALAQLQRELAETYSAGVMTRLGSVLAGLLEPAAPPAAPPRVPSRSRLPALAALTVTVALGSGMLFALVRSNRLCPSLGLCLSAGGEGEASIDATLSRATAAATELDTATSLGTFVAGLDRLDATLLSLVSRRLNPRQERQRERLQSRSDDAHRRLRQEQRAQRSLEEAAALIGELERAAPDGPQRFDVLAEARARLDEVSASSFARSSVGELEGRLAAIEAGPPRMKSTPQGAEPPLAPPPPNTGVESAPPAPTLPPPASQSAPPPTRAAPVTPPPAALPSPLPSPPPLPPPPIQPPPIQPPPALP